MKNRSSHRTREDDVKKIDKKGKENTGQKTSKRLMEENHRRARNSAAANDAEAAVASSCVTRGRKYGKMMKKY